MSVTGSWSHLEDPALTWWGQVLWSVSASTSKSNNQGAPKRPEKFGGTLCERNHQDQQKGMDQPGAVLCLSLPILCSRKRCLGLEKGRFECCAGDPVVGACSNPRVSGWVEDTGNVWRRPGRWRCLGAHWAAMLTLCTYYSKGESVLCSLNERTSVGWKA